MFPSGKWLGHWDQTPYGRQAMQDLEIQFDGRQLKGTGTDIIGEFRLVGTIDEDENVQIVKEYTGRHSVIYLGRHDGEGIITGAWALFGDDGTFALKPESRFRKSGESIVERTF